MQILLVMLVLLTDLIKIPLIKDKIVSQIKFNIETFNKNNLPEDLKIH